MSRWFAWKTQIKIRLKKYCLTCSKNNNRVKFDSCKSHQADLPGPRLVCEVEPWGAPSQHTWKSYKHNKLLSIIVYPIYTFEELGAREEVVTSWPKIKFPLLWPTSWLLAHVRNVGLQLSCDLKAWICKSSEWLKLKNQTKKSKVELRLGKYRFWIQTITNSVPHTFCWVN